ncbi:MAG TPA: 3-hydroxyacyl-ACP dehydratase FabZ [Fimbriimonadaceae bacterium]|nr:3-hydroxyacyl-ACP dehydratase FabZ [Fimbriimonadaceae bacterium]HRJ95655.1 3-hydroxyacyl-ACP dehydratase FabZ [Fimbriimonadaceae bacterium]
MATDTPAAQSMDIREIMRYLPHRFPMLLVDRIIEVVPGVRCRGLKCVTMNEAFFDGHYPGMPIMPGVLIVEAMAQAGAVILLTSPEYAGSVPVIGAIDDVKFKRPIVPGDTLISDVELLWIRSGVGRIKAVATVEGQVAASMELTFKMIPRAD